MGIAQIIELQLVTVSGNVVGWVFRGDEVDGDIHVCNKPPRIGTAHHCVSLFVLHIPESSEPWATILAASEWVEKQRKRAAAAGEAGRKGGEEGGEHGGRSAGAGEEQGRRGEGGRGADSGDCGRWPCWARHRLGIT